jgi:hypothetical protein
MSPELREFIDRVIVPALLKLGGGPAKRRRFGMDRHRGRRRRLEGNDFLLVSRRRAPGIQDEAKNVAKF